MAKTKVSHDFVPNLTGRVDPIVEQAIRDLYLRFYKFAPSTTVINQAAPAAAPPAAAAVPGTGNAPYALIFAFDGFPADGFTSPIATINQRRDGRRPFIVSFTCTSAGSTDVHGNILINGVNLLSSDIIIPAGQTGPIYATVFALPSTLGVGTAVQAVIVLSGGCVQPTLELVLV